MNVPGNGPGTIQERSRNCLRSRTIQNQQFKDMLNRRNIWISTQWCRTCGSERPKSERFCPHAHDAMNFLPGFIDAQTNRLQHVFRDLEAYGIPEMLGEQWAPYKSYTMCKYYGMWLRFFQRQPGKELACVGDVHGTPCPHTVRVDMEGEATSIRRKLEVLQMDHSMPKHAICTQWKKSVAVEKMWR